MRGGSSLLLAIGLASSVAAATAVLPPSHPLETDPFMLLVVGATAVVAGQWLASFANGRIAATVTAALTAASTAVLALESVHQHFDRSRTIVGVLLTLGLVSLVPAIFRVLLQWLNPKEPPPPKPLDSRAALPDLERTLALRPVPELLTPVRPARTILNGRWLLEPTTLADVDRGGFSVLYRASDLRRPGEVVAIKRQSPLPHLQEESRARLLREFAILTRTASPYVVDLRDAGHEEGSGAVFLVLEYHPAGSLAKRLERTYVLELRWAIMLTCGLLRALVHLHEELERPVAHRDITTRNVLLHSDLVRPPRVWPVLIDFGSARYLGDSGPATDVGITVGSVYSAFYAPCETVAGLGEWSPATDVYSVSAILYELVTGLPPFQRESRTRDRSFIRLVLDPAVEPLPARLLNPDLPPILDDLLTAGLADDPAARPARAKDLLPLLEQVGQRYGSLRISFADLRRK